MMDSIRLASPDSIFPKISCCRCSDDSRFWDRIAGKTYCPNCLEALALGEGDPLVVRTERKRCAVCHHLGTVKYITFPLHSRTPIEIELCSEHLRALVARRLGPHAFEQLRRQLHSLQLEVAEIFLLHEAFYDEYGRAIQPAVEM
jgi:hypothetical protein